MPPDETIVKNNFTSDKQNKNRKILNPQAKELILNVVNFMKQEANGNFIIPARKVQCRVAAATGFSERTVRRIVKESKTLLMIKNTTGENKSIIFPPRKITNRQKPKTGLDKLTRCVVRKIIHGSSRSTHKIIKEVGFYWKKSSNTKNFVLVEKSEIRQKRVEYLKDVNKFRKEGRTVIYVGDLFISNLDKNKLEENFILIHAGGETGFIPNALLIIQTSNLKEDYFKELSDHYQFWIKNKLIPALPPKSVVVIDGVIYQKIQLEKIPNLDSSADDMKQWLHLKNISFCDDMMKPELYDLIKIHSSKFRKQKGIIEQMLMERGHSILKLPPDHPDLNPIDLMWADMKTFLIDNIKTFDLNSLKILCQEKINNFALETWLMKCNLVKNVELQYLNSEIISE
ncbi:hypothetical protein Phum_PHUM012940 [Pediculus humanus corporis]|uniref:Tc1-like transposase DDE domain-containing protein n=1 Tax=Pediculus humanus subsp. corporis TaxID=121224 RepID=E0V9J0_PEDHC|nr:uncharacterized protein Phum_PHUM012940 [Pediculus humanus corporis]EEB10046.1 hypothetical protein Phum_PHUM012940 [Pediculus humanus corporis]